MIIGRMKERNGIKRDVSIELGKVTLQGTLGLPETAKGIVLFAHGSGSSRHSSRNRYVAGELQSHGMATLLFDLLTPEEEAVDQRTMQLRFNIFLLAKRLVGATRWVMRNPEALGLDVGYFGASTGAAAALMASAQLPDAIAAVVSRGGRPDLAGEALGSVQAPTLLIVGGNDEPVITLNQQALAELRCREKKLVIVPGATHLFEEPGALANVAGIAAEWFACHFAPVGHTLVRQAAQTR
jgi:putative phosphoribosyl transferase